MIGIASRSRRSRPACRRSSRPCSRWGRRRSPQGRDRQAAAVGGDTRFDLGDLLGQDRHADPEPDDGASARRRRPALRDRGRGLLDGWEDPARRRRRGHVARAVHAADGARQRRGGARRRDRGRPDRGGARRAGREGRARRRRDAARYPRVGEVPFDSEYKFMATFHEMEDDGRKVIRCFVKGAPDVLLARSSTSAAPDGAAHRRRRRRRPRPGRQRPARRRGPARARGGRARHRSLRVRPGARPARPGAGPDAAGAGRHRRPARKEARDAIALCKRPGSACA